VPAAAVIPAPIAYIKVVAVKKLVVEVLIVRSSALGGDSDGHPLANIRSIFTGWLCKQAIYLEKNRVFQAGLSGMH
jgi:hypothetical protein